MDSKESGNKRPSDNHEDEDTRRNKKKRLKVAS